MPTAFSCGSVPLVIDRAPCTDADSTPRGASRRCGRTRRPAPEGLARLLGATRATVLADLAAPRSMMEDAGRLQISPANASHHLTALRDAGLLTSRREGRAVLYVRTSLGDALVAA